MKKNELILRIANMPNDEITFENIEAAWPGGNGNHDEILTAKEACAFCKISRSSLWRHFPATLKIGSLPRWAKSALLKGG